MFYDNYVKLCNSVNKSPSAVALEIGISKPTVSRWKSGSIPTHATAVKVADYFGVPVDKLESVEKENAPATISEDDLKAAFWGGEKELSQKELDDLWEDVREYAKFKLNQRKGNKKAYPEG